eukprot:6197303-Pleurochrysis_carterae.AAC.2
MTSPRCCLDSTQQSHSLAVLDTIRIELRIRLRENSTNCSQSRAGMDPEIAQESGAQKRRKESETWQRRRLRQHEELQYTTILATMCGHGHRERPRHGKRYRQAASTGR